MKEISLAKYIDNIKDGSFRITKIDNIFYMDGRMFDDEKIFIVTDIPVLSVMMDGVMYRTFDRKDAIIELSLKAAHYQYNRDIPLNYDYSESLNSDYELIVLPYQDGYIISIYSLYLDIDNYELNINISKDLEEYLSYKYKLNINYPFVSPEETHSNLICGVSIKKDISHFKVKVKEIPYVHVKPLPKPEEKPLVDIIIDKDETTLIYQQRAFDYVGSERISHIISSTTNIYLVDKDTIMIEYKRI